MLKKVCVGFLFAAGVGLAIYGLEARADDLYQAAQQKQALAIYQKMTLDERIGQLLLPSYVLLSNSVSVDSKDCKNAVADGVQVSPAQIIKACGLDQIKKYHIGAVLTGGGPYFNAPTLRHWAALNALAATQHRLGSPLDPVLLTGNDAVHGNMHLQGAVIFPHNIGLGVTHDADLVRHMGQVIGQDSLSSGFNWVYAPTLAVAQDLRWGRTYESFGQQSALVKSLGAAYIEGFQSMQNNRLTGPVATAKHFIGDGATQYGFDEGDDAYSGTFKDFWQANGQGYEGAVAAQAATLMISYSAIDDQHSQNTTRMHFGGKWDILNQFKTTGISGSDGKQYRFSGFSVTDWQGATRAAYFYNLYHPTLSLAEVFAKSMNAGADMFMVAQGDTVNPFDATSPTNYTSIGEVFDALKSAYQDGLISESRLQDAVTRILAVKSLMQPRITQSYDVLQQQERALALRAAHESLVLLQNNHHVLPLKANQMKHVVLVGATDDLGTQNGGWTVNWQGQKGDQYFTGVDQVSSGALTLEQALKLHLPTSQFYHAGDALPKDATAANTVVISVVAEVPYAEYMGDIGNKQAIDEWYQAGGGNGTNAYLGLPQNQSLALQWSASDATAIASFKQQDMPVITIVYSGRPVILSEGGAQAPLVHSDAVVAAFLPGTLGGQALSDVLLGNYRFRSTVTGQSNTLSFPWPNNMSQVADHFSQGAQFPIGYGLAD